MDVGGRSIGPFPPVRYMRNELTREDMKVDALSNARGSLETGSRTSW